MTDDRPVAVIDVGSNSIVLLVARPEGAGWEFLARRKETPQLGAAIGANGQLFEKAEAGLLVILKSFIRSAERAGTVPRIVATASLRQLHDGAAVAQRCGAELGVEVEVVSEELEARLSFTGVWCAEDKPAGPIVMVDVGGGSSEIAWGEAGAMRGFVSLATGAVRLRQQFCADDPVRPQRLAAMITELDAMVAKLPQIAAPQVYAYACSGSIRRIAALCGGDPSELSVAQIDAVIESLVAAPSRAERLLIPAMDPSRVDVLLAGALIHRALAQHFGWSQFRLSSGGLRRGLLEAQR